MGSFTFDTGRGPPHILLLPAESVAGGRADGADGPAGADPRHLPVGDPSAEGRFLTDC